MDHATPPSAVAAPHRLWTLDALRGACALVVFVSHWYLWAFLPPHGAMQEAVHAAGRKLYDAFTLLAWPTGGHHPAVLGFFVLSGFCIHYPFERRALAGAPAPDWGEYGRRRFRRIMPVYWAACSLGLVFVAVETLRPSGSAVLALHAIAPWPDILVRFAGLAGLYPHEIFAGNYILTTVAVEMLMYAAYPFFHRFAIRGAWRSLGLGFLSLHLAAIALLPFVTPFWVFNSPLMLGIFWYAGALAAHLYLTGRARLSGYWPLAAWVAFLGLKSIPAFYGLNLLKQAAWGLVCVLGLLWVIRQEELWAHSRARRAAVALRYAGDISYSLYAMHTPALMLVSWAMLRMDGQNYFVQLGATLAASLAVTLAVHYGIERVFYPPHGTAHRGALTHRNTSRPAST